MFFEVFILLGIFNFERVKKTNRIIFFYLWNEQKTLKDWGWGWLTNSIILFYVWDGPDSGGFVGGTCNEMASSTITIAFISVTSVIEFEGAG